MYVQCGQRRISAAGDFPSQSSPNESKPDADNTSPRSQLINQGGNFRRTFHLDEEEEGDDEKNQKKQPQTWLPNQQRPRRQQQQQQNVVKQ